MPRQGVRAHHGYERVPLPCSVADFSCLRRLCRLAWLSERHSTVQRHGGLGELVPLLPHLDREQLQYWPLPYDPLLALLADAGAVCLAEGHIEGGAYSDSKAARGLSVCRFYLVPTYLTPACLFPTKDK